MKSFVTIVQTLLFTALFFTLQAQQNFLIVPGKSVGDITLGMKISDLSKKYELLEQENFMTGEKCHYVKKGKDTLMMIYPDLDKQFNSSGKVGKIIINQPQYKTAEGFGVGTDLKTILSTKKPFAVDVWEGYWLHSKQWLGISFLLDPAGCEIKEFVQNNTELKTTDFLPETKVREIRIQ